MKTQSWFLFLVLSFSNLAFAGIDEERSLAPGSSATITVGDDSYTFYCEEGRRSRRGGGGALYICDCTNGLFKQGSVTGTAGSNFNQMCSDQVFIGTRAVNCRKVR